MARIITNGVVWSDDEWRFKDFKTWIHDEAGGNKVEYVKKFSKEEVREIRDEARSVVEYKEKARAQEKAVNLLEQKRAYYRQYLTAKKSYSDYLKSITETEES